MNEIQGIARLKIHDGRLKEFKRVASQCMQVVRTRDTGTLQYELYLNEDETECFVTRLAALRLDRANHLAIANSLALIPRSNSRFSKCFAVARRLLSAAGA